VTPKSLAPSVAPSAPSGLAQAALRAVGAAVLGAGVWIGLAGPFAVTWGLLAVALFVGWLVGSGARPKSATPPRSAAPSESSGAPKASGSSASGPRIRAVAVCGALFAWVLALAGVYLYSLATLPSLGPAGTSLSERIATTSILDFWGPQFGPIDALEGLLLVLAAWWSAR
jgi:hypothetical protein